MWGYSHPYWPQQPYVASTVAMEHPTHSDTQHVTVNKHDASREDAKEPSEFPNIVDSPCNIKKSNIDDSVTISPDTSPDSKAGERRLSLSTLKRDYSSSSSSAATPSPSHHHDNSSTTSSPQQPLDVSNFDQQVMEFTSRRAKMIRSIKAGPLNLPSDNKGTGNC